MRRRLCCGAHARPAGSWLGALVAWRGAISFGRTCVIRTANLRAESPATHGAPSCQKIWNLATVQALQRHERRSHRPPRATHLPHVHLRPTSHPILWVFFGELFDSAEERLSPFWGRLYPISIGSLRYNWNLPTRDSLGRPRANSYRGRLEAMVDRLSKRF